MFTTVNDSPNLTHCLLMAFSDLEKRKHRNFLEKHYAGARANIEQKPYEASLKLINLNWQDIKRSGRQFYYLLGNVLILLALHEMTSIYPLTKLLFRCLAVTDLFVGLITQPLLTVTLLREEIVYFSEKALKSYIIQ